MKLSDLSTEIKENNALLNTIDIYPNPAFGSVTIVLSLSVPGEVSFDVFDMMGRHITTIANEPFEDVNNQLIWNAAGLTQ